MSTLEHSLCGCLSHRQPDRAEWEGTAEEFEAWAEENYKAWAAECAAHHVYCCQEVQKGTGSPLVVECGVLSECIEGLPDTCPHRSKG